MTGSRRPTNIPPQSPELNNDNDSEEEEDLEAEEDQEKAVGGALPALLRWGLMSRAPAA